jgi:hypothetical protein
MTLGQSLLVVASLSILGLLVLNSNNTIIETNDIQNDSEFGITAVSLATSLVEESMGKMFDAVVADTANTLSDSSLLTPRTSLGHSGAESYRGSVAGTEDFNDFDDYNNLFLVYKSNNPADTARTTGSDYEVIVPGLRSKYFVRSRVVYVQPTNLNGESMTPTWHKKMIITVTRPNLHSLRERQMGQARADTLVFPAVMSFWN